MGEGFLFPPALGTGVEIRRLSLDPFQKPCKTGILTQSLNRFAAPRQFCVGEICMYRLMTNRVERHGIPPSPAFRHWMVPFHAIPQQASA